MVPERVTRQAGSAPQSPCVQLGDRPGRDTAAELRLCLGTATLDGRHGHYCEYPPCEVVEPFTTRLPPIWVPPATVRFWPIDEVADSR